LEWELLRGLKEEEVEQVLALGHRRQFTRREVLWHAGDRAETIHFIRRGRVAVRAMTPDGEIVTVIVLGTGRIAGLVGALATEPYATTTGVAFEATETVAIRLDTLPEVRRRVPAFEEALIRFLADRTLELADRLTEALYVPAEVRVLRRLLALCEVYEKGEGTILIPLTQEDFGELAGVTRPTVNRVLQKEERRGAIKISRGSITIIDREGLTSRAT
jgi:CRP/FNR family cyclic AMP-dependent transcriptional regulator